MASWRCPHCSTLQTDTARCFLCDRSATSCGTCVNFRSSLVGGVGYCALDRRREPLSGAEQRPCWAAPGQPIGEGLLDAPAGEHPAPRLAPPAEHVRRGLIELSPTSGSPRRTQPPISGT
jgi:hypothetical protein